MKEKIKIWLAELRLPFLTATIAPIILGTAIAWTLDNVFIFWYFLLALIGGMLLNIGANVANDYFDHKSGNDEANVDFIRPFTGGSRMIQRGLLTPKEVLTGSILFFIAGMLIGVYLAIEIGIIVLVIGIIGLLSGLFYTAPPIRLANRGLGEISIGLNFGILMVLGPYYVQTQVISLEPIIAGIPVGLLIMAVLYINEFPDYKADKHVGKNTWVVRLGRKRAATGYLVMMAFVYISIALSVLVSLMPVWTLIAFATLPIAVKSVRIALKYHSQIKKLVPANVSTILCHLLTILLLAVGYLLQGLFPIIL